MEQVSRRGKQPIENSLTRGAEGSRHDGKGEFQSSKSWTLEGNGHSWDADLGVPGLQGWRHLALGLCIVILA